jgi:hypothetical protein
MRRRLLPLRGGVCAQSARRLGGVGVGRIIAAVRPVKIGRSEMIWILLGGIPLGIIALLGLVTLILDEPGFVIGTLLFLGCVVSVAYGIDQLGLLK